MQSQTLEDPFGLVGETLDGRFRIDRQVAEGGFGVIYYAWQTILDRAVALKVLKIPIGLNQEQTLVFHKTFEGEARTIARLKHSHIVEVYDFGVTPRSAGAPLLWMALEWLEGNTLEEALEDRRAEPPMDPARALLYLRPVFEAIGYAHGQGVVHRDLKPSNIFLVDSHGTAFPKVLDFGIAKILVGDEQDGQKTTQGSSSFSPDYAAPEQMLSARTGAFTDVHALALIVTEILTGHPPYAGEVDLFSAVLSDRRPTPGAKGTAVGGWEPVLAKALALRPADRYPNGNALLDALAASLTAPAGTSIKTALPSPAADVSAAPPRRPYRGIAQTLVVVSILALAAVGSRIVWRLGKSPAAPTRVMMAVLPFANLTGDREQEYLAAGLTEGMISQLGRLSPQRLAVISRTSVTQYRATKKSVKEIGRELGVEYVLECSMQHAGNHVRINAQLVQVSDQSQLWSDSYDREIEDVIALQSDVAQVVATHVRLKLTPEEVAGASHVRSLNPTAYDDYLRGRYYFEKKSLEGYGQATAYFQKAIALDPGYAAAYAGLADVYAAQPMTTNTDPGELVPKAKAAALRAVELDDRLADAHQALAFILVNYEWDWPGAQQHFRRALDLDPNNADTHRRYGLYFFASMGHHADAIVELKRAIELAPLSLPANMQLGIGYNYAGQRDLAIEQLRKLGDLRPDFWVTHFLRGQVFAAKGSYPDAIAEFETMNDPERGPVFDAYARALAGAPTEALTQIERLKAVRDSYVDATWIPLLYAALGRHDEAFAWLEKAYQLRDAGLIWLRVDPLWDPLRADARFADLIRRVGIPG